MSSNVHGATVRVKVIYVVSTENPAYLIVFLPFSHMTSRSIGVTYAKL